jgi:hypothetical protein
MLRPEHVSRILKFIPCIFDQFFSLLYQQMHHIYLITTLLRHISEKLYHHQGVQRASVKTHSKWYLSGTITCTYTYTTAGYGTL